MLLCRTSARVTRGPSPVVTTGPWRGAHESERGRVEVHPCGDLQGWCRTTLSLHFSRGTTRSVGFLKMKRVGPHRPEHERVRPPLHAHEQRQGHTRVRLRLWHPRTQRLHWSRRANLGPNVEHARGVRVWRDEGLWLGHRGTHCTGVVASKTYVVAKEAKVHGVKVLTDTGYRHVSCIVLGAEWVANHGVRPAVVIASQ